jgi:hypothetical protein
VKYGTLPYQLWHFRLIAWFAANPDEGHHSVFNAGRIVCFVFEGMLRLDVAWGDLGSVPCSGTILLKDDP